VKTPLIPAHRGVSPAFVEVKYRQSSQWTRYSFMDTEKIDWDSVVSARALYAKLGGWDGKAVLWHYDYRKL
jgi:hypothetical protein